MSTGNRNGGNTPQKASGVKQPTKSTSGSSLKDTISKSGSSTNDSFSDSIKSLATATTETLLENYKKTGRLLTGKTLPTNLRNQFKDVITESINRVDMYEEMGKEIKKRMAEGTIPAARGESILKALKNIAAKKATQPSKKPSNPASLSPKMQKILNNTKQTVKTKVKTAVVAAIKEAKTKKK